MVLYYNFMCHDMYYTGTAGVTSQSCRIEGVVRC